MSSDPWQSSLLDSTNDAIIVLNRVNVIVFWNKGAERIYGWTKKEATGKIAPALLKTHFPEKLVTLRSKIQKKTHWRGLLNQTTKKGKKIVVDSQWSTLSVGKEPTVLEVNRDVTKEFESEQRLHETKNQLEAVLENVADGIFVQNHLGEMLYANTVALNMFDIASQESIIGSSSLFYQKGFEFYDEAGEEFPFSRFPGRRVIAGEKQATETFRIVKKSTGKIQWITVRSSGILDKQTNKPFLVVSVLSDITRQRQIEESLRFLARAGEILSSSLHYEQTIQDVAMLAIESIADWCSVEMLDNDTVTLAAIAHKDPKQIIWAKKLRRENPVDLTQKTGIAKVLTTGKPEFIPVITDAMVVAAAKNKRQLALLRKINFSSVIIVPLRISGKVIGVIQFVSTDSKRYFSQNEFEVAVQLANRVSLALENVTLYENLEKEQQRINDIISNIPGIVWEARAKFSTNKRLDFVLTYISKYAEILFGYPSAHVMGKSNVWAKLVYHEDLEHLAKGFYAIYRSGKGGIVQCRFVTKDGQVKWMELQSKVIADKKGRAFGLRGVAMDITKQKELEQRKDDFVSMASHELKTPLTSTKVFAQILEQRFKKIKDAQSQKFLSRMNEQIDKLTNLVADLLDVTRIQQGKIQLNKEIFPLHDLVAELVDNLQSVTSHKFVILVSQKDAIFADRDKIRQVLTNLLTNAIKYSPGDKKIIVRSKTIGKHITVGVQDFGIGISKSQQAKIFERFYQAPQRASARNTYPGLGLGLYISSEIIRLHHGKIGVKSVPGKGSIFSFSLPLASVRHLPK